MSDQNKFKIYGGLDARKSLRKISNILSYTHAKNIDIKGKGVRRARGQTQEVVRCDDSGLATARLPWGSDNAYAGASGYEDLDFRINIPK